MKRWILIGMVVASGMTIQGQNKLPEKFPYQDTSLTAEERADDLLKRLTLEEKASLMMNRSPAIPRLSIKAYGWWNEALHGLARTGLATVFPQAIGMGASSDDSFDNPTSNPSGYPYSFNRSLYITPLYLIFVDTSFS